MSVRFEILCTLSASHAADGAGGAELDFVMPRDTTRAIQGAMLLARVRDRHLQVLFEADDDGVPRQPAPGTRLRFGFRPADPSFVEVTSLGFDPHATTALYRNAARPDALDPMTPVSLVGALLSHRITEAARPVTLTLSDARGEVLWNETVTGDDGYAMVPFHLMRLPIGRYVLEESYPMHVHKTVVYYVDPELLAEGVLGIVEIEIESSFYTDAPAFSIAFDAKQRTLKSWLGPGAASWRSRGNRLVRSS
jgi:hypothetical protein